MKPFGYVFIGAFIAVLGVMLIPDHLRHRTSMISLSLHAGFVALGIAVISLGFTDKSKE